MPKCPNCKLKMIECVKGYYCWECNFVYQRKNNRWEVVDIGKNGKKNCSLKEQEKK